MLQNRAVAMLLDTDVVLALRSCGGVFEPSWSRLGAIVGRSWAIFSLPETFLGRSWGRLGASWGRLGTILGRFRTIFGPPAASMAL